jgi:hypothetical protein
MLMTVHFLQLEKKNQSNERQELIDFARAFYAISPASANFLN